jgi:probable HAF family extracellular repeat protein
VRTLNIAIALVLSVASTAAAQVTYSVVDLGSLGGYDTSALAINSAGHVVGGAMDGNGHYVAFLYITALQGLGTLGGVKSKANAINSSDRIVGNSSTANGNTHAFLYDASAPIPAMVDLHATIGFGGSFSSATSINTAGQIVGAADIANGTLHAFLLTGTTAVDLHPLISFGGPNSFAYAISNTGWIAGVSDDASGHSRAFLYNLTTSTLTDLGTLGGPDSGGMAVDASGSVVGNSSVDATTANAYAFHTSPTLPIAPSNSLGALGGTYSFAFGINSSGQIVGEADDAASLAHAFVDTPALGMRDLEDFIPAGSGWIFSAATAINDSGQIIGNGLHNGRSSAFLLVPQLPNLVISALGAPASASPGSSIDVSQTVTNSGPAAAGSFRVGLYLSLDATCATGNTLLTSRVVSSLAAGGSSAATLSATLPAGSPLGASFICAIADDLAQIPESTETDNAASRSITVISAVPVITLKVNGQHPNPAVVNTAGPMTLTLDISASVYTAPLAWYWALVLNGQVFWVTSTGVKTTPAPLLVGPPTAIAGATLLNITLPPATTLTTLFVVLDGSNSLIGGDLISAVRP